jgi:hypothetical protein
MEMKTMSAQEKAQRNFFTASPSFEQFQNYIPCKGSERKESGMENMHQAQ